MTTWDYKYLLVAAAHARPYAYHEDGEKLSQQLPLSGHLKGLGRGGWEMVGSTIVDIDNHSCLLFFKRQISE